MNQSSFINSLKDLNISIDEEQLFQLEKYYELLVEYNKVMNLTGIVEKEEVYLKHFYDSLTLMKAIDLNKINSLCDIGTGAGFPGLVLKIVFPNIKVTLIDSLNKRITFLNKVIEELNLKDIEAIHYRIEEYGVKNRNKFDVVTARAVASTNVLLEYAMPLVKVDGYFIPLKGKMDNEVSYEHAMEELKTEIIDVIKFNLPIEDSSRTILKFRKKENTPNKYPRKNSEVKKKPL